MAATTAALTGIAMVTAVAGDASAAVGVPVTYTGPTYDSTVHRPTENKPQSKLWYTDGAWWALMVSSSDDRVHIFELLANHTWRDTGTQVDDRLDATGDAHWDAAEGRLTVASREGTQSMRVTRFAYSSGGRSWSLLPGFPLTVNTGGGSESAAIDRDSTGRFWVTYTKSARVWVAHSDPNGLNWTAGYQPAVPDVVIQGDDISSVIAFGGKIGVMWSDQGSDAFRMAVHTDGAGDQVWTVENALAGTDLADDHINLKTVVDDAQGRVYAAIKTSQDFVGPNAPLVGVLVRTPNPDGSGDWSFVVAGTVANDHTRPIIQIDQTNQELYFFATAPVTGGDIYYKKTSLSNPSFGPGLGAKFIDDTATLNNVTGSKQPVTAETGMVLLAVAESRKRYVHAEMDLAGGGDTTDPDVPTGLTATPSAGQVDLSWNASDDDVAVTGYTLRRGTTVYTTSATSFTDTDVIAGQTYSYTVEAFDAAGNTSDPSSPPVQVTVPGDPPAGIVTLRASTTAANAAEKTLSLSVPVVAQPGDVMVASVDYRGRSALTVPTGWQQVRHDVNGTKMQKATFYRVATVGEPGSYTWTFGARPAAVGSLLVFAGASSSGPVEDSGGQVTAKSASITAPSVSASAGSFVIGLVGVARSATITQPTGTSELTEVTSPSGVTYPITGETAGRTQSSGGPTGALVAQATVSGPNIGHVVVLRSAS
ncbi:MAG: hypothetical protein ACRDWY_15060 [Actinomycetes bacterium]